MSYCIDIIIYFNYQPDRETLYKMITNRQMQLTQKIIVSFVLALVLLITLFFGIKPKGYRFRNDVIWAQNNGGIHIGPIGIVYSQDSLTWLQKNCVDSGFTIEMALNPNGFHGMSIAEILGIWDGLSPEPLMIGQWKNHLIIRVRAQNGKKEYREFGVDSILKRGEKQLIQIVSSHSNVTIYDNGRPVYNQMKAFPVPENNLRGRLILGNSATASASWHGELYGMAIYHRALSPEEITHRFNQWNLTGSSYLPSASMTAHFFKFNESSGRIAHDCVAEGFNLQIPHLFHIVKKYVLVGPWDDFSWTYSYFSDVLINLSGFMPMGFLVALFLYKVASVSSWKKNIFLTIFICFCLSLSIELIQVYIPTRASQLSDLICNTLGGAGGGFLSLNVKLSSRLRPR
jgi:VanZ family protein